MKKMSKEDKYYLKMLDAERKYRAATGGDDADEPFIVPMLDRIFVRLDIISTFLCILVGVLIAHLLF